MKRSKVLGGEFLRVAPMDDRLHVVSQAGTAGSGSTKEKGEIAVSAPEDPAVQAIGIVKEVSSSRGEEKISPIVSSFVATAKSETVAPMCIIQTKVSAKDGQRYVYIPPGRFQMGCSPGDRECSTDEKPSREVTISRGFWLGQTPVTVEAYRRFTAATGRELPIEPVCEGRRLNPDWSDGKAPMVMVNGNDAMAYAAWLGGRLPTEAEWEYAARGGTSGERYGDLAAIAWHWANAVGRPHIVGQKEPNAYGLYDMLGNVWEWTADWYSERVYQDGEPMDPRGPSNGTVRTLRGGSWSDPPQEARASRRKGLVPGIRVSVVGFRCILMEGRSSF